MQKSELDLVAEGYIPNYTWFIDGELNITVSLVCKIFYDYHSNQVVSWIMYSNGKYGTSRKWIPGVPDINPYWDELKFKTDNGYIIKKVSDLIKSDNTIKKDFRFYVLTKENIILNRLNRLNS